MKFRTLLPMTLLLAGCASAPQQQAISDRQIAMVMSVLNLGEIREAQAVVNRVADPKLRDFAQAMITQHDAENNKAESALLRADINSEDTPQSRQLDASSGAETSTLLGLSGPALDRAYIDHEVQAHESALQLIDNQLMPHARHKVLKEQLTSLRKLIADHLARAKEIQASLPK